MKCHSVACVWSALPQHRVTAAAVLTDPPTLYTGGSDGSIVWWDITASESRQDVRPTAMLCGHTAAIADLAICTPLAVQGDDELRSSIVRSPVSSACYASLLSACIDGVLCVWSRGSGNCRRRRKLPPWAGTPCMVSSLPMSPRYVCISCYSADPPAYSSSSHPVGPLEGYDRGETGVERETHHRKASKCAVVIVDSYTLTIVRTVFHGGLSIGSLESMTIVPDLTDGRQDVVVIADALGKVQLMDLPTERDQQGEGEVGGQKRSSSEAVTLALRESSLDAANAVSVAPHGNLLVLIYATHFIIKSLFDGDIVEETDLGNSSLCTQDPSGAHLSGCTFLQNEKHAARLESKDAEEGNANIFTVWSTNGAAIIFLVKHFVAGFSLKRLCEIPASSCPFNVNSHLHFCQFGCYLVRIESIPFDVSGSLLWRPHVTIWAISQQPHMHSDGSGELQSQLGTEASNDSVCPYLGLQLGEGFLPDDNFGWWASHSNMELSLGANINSEEGGFTGSSIQHDVGAVSYAMQNKRFVSSSMVLPEDFRAPFTVVYGFFSGEIEVIRLGNVFSNLNLADAPVSPNISMYSCERSFSGHTGAVLCLAAHKMVEASNNHSALHVLISGGMDGTVRIWDLDTGHTILVMHHHTAPVRQLILPPPWTYHPWSDCFLSVGEDDCVALSSLETLHVERMFPGHPCYPSLVAWDSARGYIACLCRNLPPLSDAVNYLYIWDVKTGARDRILRGTASLSMFDHFCLGINLRTNTGNTTSGITSAPSLLLSLNEDAKNPKTFGTSPHKTTLSSSSDGQRRIKDLTESDGPLANVSKVVISDFIYDNTGKSSGQVSEQGFGLNKKYPIKCTCPFPGILALEFDLLLLMSLCQTNWHSSQTNDDQDSVNFSEQEAKKSNSSQKASNDGTVILTEGHPREKLLEESLLRFSLSLLHLWDIDHEVDKLLVDEMNLCKPAPFVASGVLGDRGSLTLIFPALRGSLQLWKCSPEFSAMRSLTIVSLAQRMICSSHSSSEASSELAAFYTRKIVENVPDIRPPLLQLLASFWQDPSEPVRMAARSLFHCAAPRSIPRTLFQHKVMQPTTSSNPASVAEDNSKSDEKYASTYGASDAVKDDDNEETSIIQWLESFEIQDWVSCVGGTAQDAMASQIIVAAALAVWYPSIVKPKVSKLVIERLLKLVMAMNDRYSSTAAELLAEGMDSTWKAHIGPDIPHLLGDVFFQIECLSSGSSNSATQNPAVTLNIRETLVDILLPSLAMVDISGFFKVIESQIWATSSDSPVHLVSLNTLIRVIRGSPKSLVPFIDKVVNYVLHTMDHGNSVLRKNCLNSSMTTLREVARTFPMVALNERSSRLAVGDAIGDISGATIRVYDIESVTKIKILDASGPPGLPSLLAGGSNTVVAAVISALSFSPDGEGLVAFSEHGLTIRWWSLGTAWWEKLSRSSVPAQCTKLIFVPPWEGFSPSSTRSSIMASISRHHEQSTLQVEIRVAADALPHICNPHIPQAKKTEPDEAESDSLKILLQNLDLSYQLSWTDGRKVSLTRHGQELGSFQL